jgi:signal transduction histidine kinase
MNLNNNPSGRILVFGEGDFPVISSAFHVMVLQHFDKVDDYCRNTTVDVAFVATTGTHPDVVTNVLAINKKHPDILIVAIVTTADHGVQSISNGACDCLLKDEVTVDAVEQRIHFVRARAKYLRHGGGNMLYGASDLAAMSRVLSHDIRNSLSGIMLSMEQLKSLSEKNEEAVSYINIVDRSASKINQLVNRFSSATGNVALRMKNENAVELIKQAIASLPALTRKPVKVTESYSRMDITMSVDKEKFPLAILNLLTNAADAIEAAGKGEIQVSVEVVGNSALISILDNGHGIDYATQQHIFRPFFTTRSGKAGLGLPLAYNIILAHGGTLKVESINGASTHVICTLPVIG